MRYSQPLGAETVATQSAKNISVRAEWLRQSGHAPSEPSETPRWQTTPCQARIGHVTLHIAIRLRFRRVVWLCRYPFVNDHRGVVANCDHTLELVHWVRQQNVYWSGSHTQSSIRTRHFVYHIRLCYSHKIRYLIIWHALFRYLYIDTSTAVSPPWTFRHTSHNIQTEFVRKNGSSWRSLGRKWEDMILPGHANPRNCVDLDEMKMSWCLSTPGSPEYVLPVAQSTSVTPVSPYTCHRSLMMYLDAMIERVERCTWRPRSSELRDALGVQD